MKILLNAFIGLAITLSSFGQTWLDNSCPIKEKISNEEYASKKPNNVLSLIINQEGKLLLNGKRNEGMSEIQFKEFIYDFLTNPSDHKAKADSPKQAIIALGSYGEHDSYNLILKYVREVYLYVWDTAAEERYNTIYMNLDCKQREKVRKQGFPYKVLELNHGEDEKKPSFSPGVPSFSGDVKDN
ncbi:hypothetical protein [Psychroflexus sediminis]|uniref:Biopolymer transport protein ExbD/TolR n=1 Tax=Psychroflexus sediminis TaxID=470826 RepID=A0A1G7Y8S7_9FLAO|nr:hypothetical protein [Psychroflexus sediminis]SDG92767.1 hypothetical protein SAMN04488027_11142 [Psychroflexus sediminis]